MELGNLFNILSFFIVCLWIFCFLFFIPFFSLLHCLVGGFHSSTFGALYREREGGGVQTVFLPQEPIRNLPPPPPPLFICGAADRSGKGKRCSCCYWGGTFFQSPMYCFLGCDKAKTLSKKRCDKAKTLSKKGCD